jgi:hypothetical protein
MKGKWLLLLFPLLGFFSCAGEPEPVEPEEPVYIEEFYSEPVSVVPAEEEDFDPATITEEVFADTLTEVQHFIEDLNGLISGKNYNSWLAYLGDSYLQMINSPEYLQRISESSILKKQKVVLKTAQDYFTYVVVPSRASARVDDIEFITQNRVKAFTLNQGGDQRLRLYDLEKSQGNWKIIN